jgi:diacylglycerol kinase (ATP)
LAKVIKDIAAGAVFVSAVNATITGYVLFIRRFQLGIDKDVYVRIKQSPWHITLIALLVIIGLVILIKVIRHEKFVLRGGMPSGHAAVAFSVWIIITLVTSNALASILVFVLAAFVARTRVLNKVHTFWEVVAGAVLGALITLLIFQILS